jgi:hypothetical protein
MLPTYDLQFIIANKQQTTRIGCCFTPSPYHELFLSKLKREQWKVISQHTIDLRQGCICHIFEECAENYSLLRTLQLTAALYLQGVTTAVVHYEKMYLMAQLHTYQEIIPVDFSSNYPEVCDIYLDALETIPQAEILYNYFYFKGVEAAYRAGYDTIVTLTRN